MNIQKSDNSSYQLVQNQYFHDNSNKLEQYNKYGALARISFINCTFEEVFLLGTVFGSCSFQDCTFNHFNARKGTFSNCHFEGCTITNVNMTRAEFYDTTFKNCEFLNVDLAASDFDDCKFEAVRFFESNLNLIGVEKVKVWKSKEWITIDDFSSFQKHVDE